MRTSTSPRAPRSPLNRERTGAQRSQLLSALQECFPQALPYDRLREVAGMRPGARVDELRRQGWAVERVILDSTSKVCTYRLASLQQGEELETHAAITLYSDSASGWTSRVHADLSGRYSDAQLAAASAAALSAFRAALSRGDRVSASSPRVSAQAPQVSRAQPQVSRQPDFSVPLDQLSSDWRTW